MRDVSIARVMKQSRSNKGMWKKNKLEKVGESRMTKDSLPDSSRNSVELLEQLCQTVQ